MKIPTGIAVAIGWLVLPAHTTTVNLSGKVLELDSTNKSGVVVSLSGTNLTTTTGDDGTWSLAGETGGTGLLAPRSGAASRGVSRRVVMDGSRLRLSLGGRDICGHPLSGETDDSFASAGSSARSGSSSVLDTLIYSLDGTVILRDTISEDSLVQSGILRISDAYANASVTYGYVSDAQGHVYRTTKIGEQTWMAQNLNYVVDSSWCPDGSATRCHTYGRLYKWAAVMGLDDSCDIGSCSTQVVSMHQGLCPNGWHVPTYAEWSTLRALSDTVLKSRTGWSLVDGSDSLGFRAQPAGDRYSGGSYYFIGFFADFQTADQWRKATFIGYNSLATIQFHGELGKDGAVSARCLQD